MLKRFIYKKVFLLALVFGTSLVQALPSQCLSKKIECPPYQSIDSLLEVKGGYFFFANSTMRKIYDKGGYDLQVSGSFSVATWPERYGLDIYASVEFLHCSGKTIGGNEKTSIWEIPVNLGLKPIIAICTSVQYYFAIGPRYFHLHQHNNSSTLVKNIDRNGIGLFANTGFNFFPTEHLLIDVFGEYSYTKISFHSSKRNVFGQSIQVGGFVFGVGLGYAF